MANHASPLSVPLTVCTWNADGVRSRIHELLVFLREHSVGILLLTETHLSPGISFHLPGYTIFRKDRLGGPGGGVAVCATTKLSVQRVDFDTVLETVGLETKIADQIIRFVAIYNPPSQTIQETELGVLLRPGTLIGGDLNSKHPAWGSRHINRNGRTVFKFVTNTEDMGLWAPEDATSIPSGNRQGDVIDLFLGCRIPNPRQIETIFALSSDHYPVVCQWGRLPVDTSSIRRIRWPQFRALSSHIGEHSAAFSSAADVDRESMDLSQAIQQLLAECTEELCGRAVNRLGLGKSDRDLILSKNQAKARWSKHRRAADRRLYRRLQRDVREMLRNHEQDKWTARITAANEETGKFWKLLRGSRPRPRSNAPLIVNGIKYFEPESKAQQAAEFLSHQFENSDATDTSTHNAVAFSMQRIHFSSDPSPGTFSVRQVREKIRLLHPKKSPGPDGIPNQALRNLDASVIPRLTALYNAVIRFHHVPPSWKQALVIAIPKGDKDPTKLDNLRPISLLCGISKIFESLLKDFVQDFAEERHLIPPVQFGFQSKLAAIQQAANLAAVAARASHPRWKVMAALLDVAKAYDRVWRHGLLHKMFTYKFPMWLLKVLRSWLQLRTFQVRVGTSLSAPHTALEGLPQGSPLSPVLFNVYVADIPTFPKDPYTQVFQFADDTAIATYGKSVDVARDRLSKGVGAVVRFAETWKIRLNHTKTETILFGTRRPAWPYVPVARHRLRLRPQVTYLGVIIDRRRSFLAHMKRRAGLAEHRCSRLFNLIRDDSGLSVRNRRRLFKSVLEPTAFYGMEISLQNHQPTRQLACRKQTKLLRKALGAPWFIRNADMLADLQIDDILSVAERRRREMIQRLLDHESEAIKKLGQSILDQHADMTIWSSRRSRLKARLKPAQPQM